MATTKLSIRQYFQVRDVYQRRVLDFLAGEQWGDTRSGLTEGTDGATANG
jgi:hypothetical protein